MKNQFNPFLPKDFDMARLIDLFNGIETEWNRKLSTEFSDKCKKSDLGLYRPESRPLDFRNSESYRKGKSSPQVGNSEYFRELCRFIDCEYKGKINPDKENIFRALMMTPFRKTKVVILGQDPYPESTNACGLSFSAPSKKVPSSLDHIFRVLYEDIVLDGEKCNDKVWKDVKPSSGCLESWTQKGVLLLNAALTLSKGSVKHTRLWRPFTTRILRILNEQKTTPVVFLLWGDDAIDIGIEAGLYEGVNRAAKRRERRVNSEKNLVLDASHPSSHKWQKETEKASQAFRGCRHFSDTNDFLGKKIFTWPIPSK